MDRIDLYRIFARVVEAGGFTKAAATLDIPRSTVSTAVGALEERVGTRLLHRTTRSVSVTQDGREFYDRCTRLIADVEEAESSFRRDNADPVGRVHVDLPGRVGRLIVAPALPQFLAQYPGISVQLGVTDRAVNLVGENVDCAVRVGVLEDSELIARFIGDLSMINVASPAYLAAHGTPRSPADLAAGHFAVGYSSPTTGRSEEWEWVEAGALRSIELPARVTVNSAEAYVAGALAGLGLIQLPAYDVAGHVAAGELVSVMPHHQCAPMPMHLLYPHRRHLSHRVKLFADWLVELLRERTAV